MHRFFSNHIRSISSRCFSTLSNNFLANLTYLNTNLSQFPIPCCFSFNFFSSSFSVSLYSFSVVGFGVQFRFIHCFHLYLLYASSHMFLISLPLSSLIMQICFIHVFLDLIFILFLFTLILLIFFTPLVFSIFFNTDSYLRFAIIVFVSTSVNNSYPNYPS